MRRRLTSLSSGFFVGFLLVSACFGLEIQTRVSDKVKVLLPTPIRFLGEADFEVAIRTGFGRDGSFTNFRPLVSLIEGEEETLESYTRTYGIEAQETAVNTQTRMQSALEKRIRRILEAKDKFTIDPKGHEFYMELGGHRVLWSQRFSYLRKFSATNEAKIEIKIPVVTFSQPDKETWVRYRFYKFSQSIIANANSIPWRSQQDPAEYWKKIILREQDGKYLRGSDDPKNAPRSGYVLSTCVEFRNLGAPNTKPVLDFETNCWIYDLKQWDEALPLVDSSNASQSKYLVMNESSLLKNPRVAKIDLFEKELLALPTDAKAWTEIQ